MKIFTYALVAVLALILIVLCVFLLSHSGHKQAVPSQNQTTFPTGAGNQDQTGSQTSQGTAPADVSVAFRSQIQNANQITLKNTIVAYPYALQNWDDQNKGGQALLEYQNGKWTLITLGGGAWDLSSLENAGVPQATAQQLLSSQ